MKSKYCVIILLIIMAVSSFFAACGKDRWEEYYPVTRHNLWIDSVMRVNCSMTRKPRLSWQMKTSLLLLIS